MSVLGSLSIKLGIVTQGFDTSINNSKAKLGEFNNSVNVANKALSAFGVTLGLAGAVQGIRTVIDYADQIDDLGKAFDISISKVLQFRDALGQSGGKAENAERILGQLFDKIETAKNSMVTDDIAKQFAKLGLSIQDLKTMQPEQALTAVFNGLSKIGNTYERVALIKDLLGKSGIGLDVKNLAVLMDESSTKFDKNAAAIKTVGDAADHIQESINNLKLAVIDMIAPFTKDGVVSVNTFKAALVGLGSVVVISTLSKVVTVILELKKAIEGAAKAQAVLTALQGWKGIATIATAGAVAYGANKYFDSEDQASSAPTLPGQYSGIHAPSSMMIPSGVSALESKNLFATTGKPIEFKLAPSQAELDKYKTKPTAAIKETYEALEEIVVSATQLGKLNVDELLASKRLTANTKDQLQLEKDRLQLKSDSYLLSAQEQKIAEIELDRREQLLQKQSELKALESSSDNQINIKARQEGIQAEIESINQLADAQIRLANQEEEHRTNFVIGWENAWKNFKEQAEDKGALAANLFNSAIGNMSSAIDSFVKTGKFAFNDFARSVIQDIMSIILRYQMMQIILGIGTAIGGAKFTAWAGKVGLTPPGRAAGGYIDRPTLVGENGAELFVPNRPGTIIPHARMNDFMGGGQPQMVVNGTYIANMSAIDTQSAAQFLARNKQSVYAANQSAMRGLPAGR